MIIERNGWSARANALIVFSISLFVQLHAGTLYGFAVYEASLGEALDTKHVAIIGSIGDAGLFLGVLTGIFYAYFDKMWTSVFSMVMLTGGYLGCYLSLLYFPSVAAFCVFYFMIGQGSQGLMFICLTVNSANFPLRNRGLIMGILLGFFALSAIVWTLVYQYVVLFDIRAFYLTLACSSFVACTMTFFLVGYATPENAFGSFNHESPAEDPASSTVTDGSAPEQPVSGGTKNCFCVGDDTLPNEDTFMRVDISGLTVLKLPEFWLLWSIEFVLVGVALMWKNHVGMFGFERDYTTIVVMSWVAVNAASRMLTGYTSDLLRNVFPRAGFFMIGACVMFVSHLLMLVAPAFGTMWLANVCTGIAYGMCICGLNQIISIYFGLPRFGFNHGMVNTSGALGGLFFTAMAELIANAQDLKSAKCLGANRLQCYRYPFALSAGFLVIAIYLSVVAIRQYPPKFLLYRAVAAE